MSDLLHITNLHVNVADTEILHGIDLTVGRGETHVIMGPNGAGKSTLGYAIMGNPNYDVTEGNIIFKDKDITGDETNERAKEGIFLSFHKTLRKIILVSIHIISICIMLVKLYGKEKGVSPSKESGFPTCPRNGRAKH